MDAIRGFFEANRFLSNFWPARVTYGGVTFDSVENAYQAAKCADAAEMAAFMPLTPKEAKERGSTVALRPDWFDIRIDVMRGLLMQKFNHPDLRMQLLATGDALLVEDNDWGDQFWGVCEGIGENNLGKLLMAVRSHLRADPRA